MDNLDPTNTSSHLLYSRRNPEKWISFMKVLWIVFAITGIVRGLSNFNTFFCYLIPIGLLGFAVHKRQKVYFAVVLLGLIPIAIVETINLLAQFTKSSLSSAILGIVFTIASLILILYTAFCCLRVSKKLPDNMETGDIEDLLPTTGDSKA